MAERWYARLSPFMRHTLGRKSLIFFNDQPDFQQNNVTDIEGEGTGGVTEPFRTRVVMPFTGIYNDTHHVLGHELVHVFQFDVSNNTPGSSQGLAALPLWLVEGMAEYLSLGRSDVNTAMWLRDAARRNDVPTIRQLTTDPRYFPYRYGQALWAYVGGPLRRPGGGGRVPGVAAGGLRAGHPPHARREHRPALEELGGRDQGRVPAAHRRPHAARQHGDAGDLAEEQARRRVQHRPGAQPRRAHGGVLLEPRPVRRRPVRGRRRDGARHAAARLDQLAAATSTRCRSSTRRGRGAPTARASPTSSTRAATR
jgi:hypothetical protein